MIIDDVTTLLTPPAAWIKGQAATDAEGRPASPRTPAAVCFCLIGALSHFDTSFGEEPYNSIGKAIFELFPDRTKLGHLNVIAAFNDHPLTTHADVLRVLEHAKQ